MNQSVSPSPSQQDTSYIYFSRLQFGLYASLIGMIVFLLGAKPEWFALDRSPVVGFIQIAVFLLGLGIICIGGYVGLAALWGSVERSIAADIGMRLVSKGYVLAGFTGMADLCGMGTQPLPEVPFFGPLQATGMEIGQAVILVGLLIMIPYKRHRYT
ncbi:MAG: hypothetical protein L3J16_01890 [Anaerolineales bacterium]|nr:hypothetical protein [Anaerolineales bacterium]